MIQEISFYIFLNARLSATSVIKRQIRSQSKIYATISLSSKLDFAPVANYFKFLIRSISKSDYTVTEFHTPTTYNNPTMVKLLTPFIEEIVGKEQVVDLGMLSGSEDFSHISQEVPATFIVLGTGKEGNAPVHNPRMQQ